MIREIDVNDDGYVTDFNLEWAATTEASNNVSLIVFAVVQMLMPSNVEEILRDYDFAVKDKMLYETTCVGLTAHKMLIFP